MANLTFLLVTTVLCTSAAQIFQKRAAMAFNSSAQSDDLSILSTHDELEPRSLSVQMREWIAGNRDLLISFVLLGSGLLLWMMVLTQLDVSLAYPLLSINYVLVLLAARILFGERVPSHRWVGAFAIVSGIFLLLGEVA